MSQKTCQPERPNSFDLFRSPLRGFNLIDASAGTGKTYTICALVLRLLLEKDLTIDQILVVTYTEAATEDLRSRIRQKLRQALDAAGNPPGDDTFLQEYLARHGDPGAAAQRISEALRSFDEAAIFTIHGFCQRMLLENSFESNTLFDTELVVDDSYIIREIVEDFWRRNLSHSSMLFSQYGGARLAPDALQDFLRPFLPHPFLQFIPAVEFTAGCGQLSGPEAQYVELYRAVCREWAAARDEVSDDLLHSPALNRSSYKQTGMQVIIGAMDDMAAACLPSPYLFDRFDKLASSRITSGTKKKMTPNILPFYELCEQLVQARDSLHFQYDRCLLALKKRLLDSLRPEIARRKARDNVFSFDDLLQRLHAALSGQAGYSLARTLEQKYPAALIDEFQDTDPLQFEIFKAIYKKRSLLFLIGDPKQAIYSFRGADIFTYMDAAAGAPLAHHTLDVNHRSTPELVKAVNTLFCRAKKPFIFEAISFQPVYAAPKQDREHFTIDGQQEEPFILWYLDRVPAMGNDASSSPAVNQQISKTTARKRIISAVAAEVCRLLTLASEDRACINDRKLLPGDIAILVRTNDEARKMQQVLTRSHVPSVLHSGDDLFCSEEAKEMSFLLNAIVLPDNIHRVKTALLTRFMDLQAKAINLLLTDSPEHEEIMEQWLRKCRTYHELWARYGFIQMFWAVMRENRVRQRVLASENGERSLTNILHLAEILHQESVTQGLNMASLLGYLQERLARDQTKNSEQQMRLESDEDRVRIVTIHKAKGLEYPVVFCPFTWEGLRSDARKGCLFHRQQAGRKTELIFDAGSAELENHVQNARQEEMAENLRLLYVALTRAVQRCYLAWGSINGAETSAPAYLLHQGASVNGSPRASREDEESLMDQVAARLSGLTDQEILADLNDLAAAAEGSIRIAIVGELRDTPLSCNKEKALPLRPRTFRGSIASDWRISSFSSLTADTAGPAENELTLQDSASDRDNIPAAASQPMADELEEQADKSPDIFSFPRGARPGTFLHELLEQADFSDPSPVAEHRLGEKLQNYGYEKHWTPVLAEMLANLGNVQLHDDIPGLKLSSIRRENCLHELEFYFPLSRLTPGSLRDVFPTAAQHGSPGIDVTLMHQQLERLTFAPARGYMRGFIDLVFEHAGRFYVLDWKSNYLGPAIEHYHRDKLTDSILSGFYFLQYHIYCLALHLYLQNRIAAYQYGSHFGGVFYIFLRGVRQDLGPGSGIYHDLPDLSTIERLNAKFLAGAHLTTGT